MTFLPCLAHATASAAVKTIWPHGAAGAGGQALGERLAVLLGRRVDDRVQQLVELGRA